MKRSAMITGTILVLLLSMWIYPSLNRIDEYVYQETTEGEIEEFVWRVEQNGKSSVLTSMADDGTQVYHLDEALHTLAWQRCDKDSATLLSGAVDPRGNLLVEGVFAGALLKKTVDLKGLPWMQKYPFSLKSFVLSPEESCEFWTLKFDDLKPYKLLAKKDGEEMIESPNGNYQSCKIRVSAAGWRSKFYSVYYWYRKTDGVFVRFEGVNGPPGSPKTEIMMLQEASLN